MEVLRLSNPTYPASLQSRSRKLARLRLGTTRTSATTNNALNYNRDDFHEDGHCDHSTTMA